MSDGQARAGSVTRGAVVAFLVLAILGGAGLALAGASDQRDTAFSLGISDSVPVVTLRHGQRACQGPVMLASAFAGLELWLAPVPVPGTTLRVKALSAAGSLLASGAVRALSPGVTSPGVRLSRTVPPGASFSLCFENGGQVPASLIGGPAQPGSGVLGYEGRNLGSAASIVLLRPQSSSLLSLLPTLFRRAALFRPTWMGAWTFWLLLAALVAGFGLVALALGLTTVDDPQP